MHLENYLAIDPGVNMDKYTLQEKINYYKYLKKAVVDKSKIYFYNKRIKELQKELKKGMTQHGNKIV